MKDNVSSILVSNEDLAKTITVLSVEVVRKLLPSLPIDKETYTQIYDGVKSVVDKHSYALIEECVELFKTQIQ